MYIYVASSWKNPYQQDVVGALRNEGYDVYDFRNPTAGDNGFSWKELDPLYPRKWDVNFYRAALQSTQARRGYRHDIEAVQKADVCVFVLPCGRSAAWEFGYMMGQGKRGIVLQIDSEDPDLMFREAEIVGSIAELLQLFKPTNCQACAHMYLDDGDFICGHPKAGIMGKRQHQEKPQFEWCGENREAFRQHPLRTPEGGLRSLVQLGRKGK